MCVVVSSTMRVRIPFDVIRRIANPYEENDTGDALLYKLDSSAPVFSGITLMYLVPDP